MKVPPTHGRTYWPHLKHLADEGPPPKLNNWKYFRNVLQWWRSARNEQIIPNFWQQEHEAGIPGNGREQDVNISLFAIFLWFVSDYNLFIGWFQLYYFHFYYQLSWLDVIQDDHKFALATMQNFRCPFEFQRFFKTLLMWLWHVMMVIGKQISKLKDLQSLNFRIEDPQSEDLGSWILGLRILTVNHKKAETSLE